MQSKIIFIDKTMVIESIRKFMHPALIFQNTSCATEFF